jgi:hypothetical protein
MRSLGIPFFVFLKCVSLLFLTFYDESFVSLLVVFLVYGKYFPFCTKVYFFNFAPPVPRSSSFLLLCPFTLCNLSINCIWFPCKFLLVPFMYYQSDYPVRALTCALSWFCFGSLWTPGRCYLLRGHVEAAFIEHRLSLLILFTVFFVYFRFVVHITL